MPGLVPGIHVLLRLLKKNVDGRDKPGHDERAGLFPRHCERSEAIHSAAKEEWIASLRSQ
jgi:hypothetical protein